MFDKSVVCSQRPVQRAKLNHIWMERPVQVTWIKSGHVVRDNITTK